MLHITNHSNRRQKAARFNSDVMWAKIEDQYEIPVLFCIFIVRNNEL